MAIQMDAEDRIMITSNMGFGRYNHKSNWVKVTSNKKGNFVTIGKKKINLNDLKQMDNYRWLYSYDFDENYNKINKEYLEVHQYYYEQ